jgi:hypothetical protein
LSLLTLQLSPIAATDYQTNYVKAEVPPHLKLFFDLLDSDHNGELDKEEVRCEGRLSAKK